MYFDDEDSRGERKTDGIQQILHTMMRDDPSFAKGMLLMDPSEIDSDGSPSVHVELLRYFEARGSFVGEVALMEGPLVRSSGMVEGFVDDEFLVVTRASSSSTGSLGMEGGVSILSSYKSYEARIVDGIVVDSSFSSTSGRQFEGHLMESLGRLVLVEGAEVRPVVGLSPEDVRTLRETIASARREDSLILARGTQVGPSTDGPVMFDEAVERSIERGVDVTTSAFDDVREAVWNHERRELEGDFGDRLREMAAVSPLVDDARSAIIDRGGSIGPEGQAPEDSTDPHVVSIRADGSDPYVADFVIAADGTPEIESVRMRGVSADGASLIEARTFPDGSLSVRHDLPRDASDMFLMTEAGRLYAVTDALSSVSEVSGLIGDGSMRDVKAAVAGSGGVVQVSTSVIGTIGNGPVSIGEGEFHGVGHPGLADEVERLVQRHRDTEPRSGALMSQAVKASGSRTPDSSESRAVGPSSERIGWMDRVRSAIGMGGRD